MENSGKGNIGAADPGWLKLLPESIRNRLRGRASLHGILHNIGWLMGDRVYRMGVGMIIGVWIARYLGPTDFGLLNYAVSVTTILGAFATLGLDSILVRELVKRDADAGTLLGTSLLLRILSGIVVVALSSFTALVAGEGPGSRLIIIVLSFGFIAQAMDVFDYYFQARVRSRNVVLARNISFTVIGLCRIWLLTHNGSLIAFAALIPVELFLTGAALWLAFRRDRPEIVFSASVAEARALLRDGWPLALSGIAILVYMKIDQVLIEKMMGEAANGIYAAAVRLVEVWYFVPSAVTVSIFPAIVRSRRSDPALYKRRLAQLYAGMAWVSLAIAGLTTVVASPLMELLYGNRYAGGAGVLAVYAWSGVATFLGVASSQFLMSENLTRVSLYRTLVGMVLNVILNLILIPRAGLIGSALATLISYTAATFSIALHPLGREQARLMLAAFFPLALFRSNAASSEHP